MELTKEYRNTTFHVPKDLNKGLDAFLFEILGKFHRRHGLKSLFYKRAEKIYEKADQLKHISDRKLKDILTELSAAFRLQKYNDQVLFKSMAAIVESSDRQLGLRPFIVQIMGALAIHDGYLIEMATGEGKSLLSCLPAVMAGWTGRPCHIVTVNDYLSNRDAAQMLPLYRFCGVSVGCVTGEMESRERMVNYGADVVYTTGKELAADFLRDRLKLGKSCNSSQRIIKQIMNPGLIRSNGLVMRGLHNAIVDEADSVLIDEAVTPLIISCPKENKPLKDACEVANKIVLSLNPDADYKIDTRFKDVQLKDELFEKIAENLKDFSGIWQNPGRYSEVLKQALLAKHFYNKNQQYIIQNGKIVIVDEFTGRAMPNRSWRQGLHQAVEAKEGLELTDPSETLARISFQQFFRLFKKLSGMTGTAQEAVSEFWYIYQLPVIRIPTNRPCQRKEFPESYFGTSEKKWEAVIDETIKMHHLGRPVLIGTRNIKASEKAAAMLTEKGVAFNLLNAINHKKEAQIIQSAGLKKTITIATNMAGRGTDIKLGRGVIELGGLHVISTEKNEAARIDRQLFGRGARQGDPGTCHAFMSLDDELLDRFVSPGVKQKMKVNLQQRIPGAEKLSKKIFSYAQKKSEKYAYRQRKSVLKTDTWLKDSLGFAGRDIVF